MRIKLRGMTLAAILLSASTSVQAADNEYVADTNSPQAFVGDVVGDMPIDNSQHVGDGPVQPIADFAPVTVGDLRPTSFSHGGAHVSAASCSGCDDPGCDGYGCDSMFGRSKSHGLGKLMNLCGKDGWIRAEGLLMWHAERNSVPLVTSAPAGVFPVLPNADIVWGDDLEGGISGGIRADIGRYLTDSFGIGGRFTWVGDNGDDFSASGDQNSATDLSLGRPYYFVPVLNPGQAQEDVVIISQQNLFTGNVQSEFETKFLMADAYARFTFCHNRSSRLELIGGYTYAMLDDMLSIQSSRVDTSNQTLPGTIFRTTSDTENRFNGGQVGFEAHVTRGCWSARMLSKIHLGNMQQTVTKLGTTTDLLGNTVVGTQNSSVLIDEEQGTETQDVFTFIPEMNFTLGYRFRDHVSFTAGYTFMYFDRVALAGEQLDRNRDTATLGANVVPVSYDIVEGSHWIQGITLGASVDF